MFSPYLPPELLLLLVTFLEAEGDINSLSQTNRQLYNLLTPYLYQLNSRNSSSALLWAANNGSEATAKMSLHQGGNIGVTDNIRRTPLSLAAQNGNEAIVKLLLETGQVDVDSKDLRGRTPLSRAANNGHEAIVKLLLETGQVDVDSKDSDGGSPLNWAAFFGHMAVVKHLLETGQVDIDSRTS